MPGSLAARDISKSYARRAGARPRVARRRARATAWASSARTASASRPCCGVLAGLEQPDAGRVIARRRGRLPAAGARGPARGDGARLPRPANRRRRGRGGAGRSRGAARRASTRSPARTPPPSTGSSPSAATTSTPALRRCWTRSGSGPPPRPEVRPLSGGEAARAALAAILLARFDVFLLDEPTNNLDFAGLARLERFLSGLRAGVVLVSHDRDFLDRTINRVVEIEAETRRMHEYAGTWSEYEAFARARPRTARGRPTPTTSTRSDRYTTLLDDRRRQAHTLGGERKLARQTGGADRRATNALRGKVNQAKNHLERLEEVEKPWSPWRLQMEFAAAPPTGTIAELAGAVVEVGSFPLGPLDLALHVRRPPGRRRRERRGQDDADPRADGRAAARRGSRRIGPAVVFGELTQARDLFAGVLLDDFADAVGPHADRRAHAAREVRTRARRHRPAGGVPLARRAHARGARAALGPRRQLPDPRRADEPPRPRGDRGARDGPRDLRGLPRRRHPRPALPQRLAVTRTMEL